MSYPIRTVSARTISARIVPLAWLVALLVGWLVQPAVPPARAAAAGTAFAHFAGRLNPGETLAPTYQWLGSEDKPINLKLAVAPAADGAALSLTVLDPANRIILNGTSGPGQALWGTATLRRGITTFSLKNTGTGSTALSYDIWLYDINPVPASFDGTSRGSSTWASQFNARFPADGLYTFALGASAGRYQLTLDQNYLRKTAESGGSVTYFVTAGMHLLAIQPDASQPQTTWTLNITGPGPAADSLPYSHEGGRLGGSGNAFTDEWLPIDLSAASSVNLKLTLSGEAADAVTAYVYLGPSGSTTYTSTKVYGGETAWWTTELPAGLNRLRLVAAAGNRAPLGYALTVDKLPSAPLQMAGVAQAAGSNAHLRFHVAADGLYDFSYGLASGRYQFVLDSRRHTTKTVEAAGSGRYYLAGGDHDLVIRQDPAFPTTGWSLGINATSQAADSLPYTISGGHLGGSDNFFTNEWLPLYLTNTVSANVRLQVLGDAGDRLTGTIYREDGTIVATGVPVYGGETVWWTADLAAGLAEIQLLADSRNSAPLSYNLTIDRIAETPHNWQGTARAAGAHSALRISTPVSGTYHFSLNTPDGFAHVELDGAAAFQAGQPALLAAGHLAEFDAALSPGLHNVLIEQATDYPITSWALTVTNGTPASGLAHFTGQLAPGAQVAPELPLPGGQARDVNFRLVVPEREAGGRLALTINPGAANSVAGTVLAGETAWGPLTLAPGQNIFRLKNSGSVTVTYDLAVYERGSTPADWSGVAQPGSSWNSAIRLNFPADGLYKFDFGTDGGRYQMSLGNQYLATTVEAAGSRLYFVPAGNQVLKITADPSAATAIHWSLHVTPGGAASDSLPYSQHGGHLRGAAGSFGEEWLPINLTEAAAANFQFKVYGAASDAVDIYCQTATGALLPAPGLRVFGGETAWTMVALPAGTSRVHVVAAAGNTSSLAYDLVASAAPAAPSSWSGTSAGNGGHSTLRFLAPAAGLYDFKYGKASGRYQFAIDATPSISKTVETAGEVRYYLAAGPHDLSVVQDSQAVTTAWSLQILPAGQDTDALPYSKAGGDLGGQANPFTAERLPFYAASSGPANFQLTLIGDRADALSAAISGGAGPAQASLPTIIHGGETVWWTANLAAGFNRIDLAANAANKGRLSYRLTVNQVPLASYTTPFTWSGVSRDTAASSAVQVQAPVDGTYHVIASMPQGFANVYVDPAGPAVRALTGTELEFDVPLAAGAHQFEVRQNSQAITTTWAVTVSLQEGAAPQIAASQPITIDNDSPARLTISGANFQPDAVVRAGNMMLGPVTWAGPDQLAVDVSANLPTGTYELAVTNPDGKVASLADGLTITEGARRLIFLPMVKR